MFWYYMPGKQIYVDFFRGVSLFLPRAPSSFSVLMCCSWMRLFCASEHLFFVCFFWKFISANGTVISLPATTLFVSPVEAVSMRSLLFKLHWCWLFWLVSIVTERANHARDHLIAEADLDKYDGWVLDTFFTVMRGRTGSVHMLTKPAARHI